MPRVLWILFLISCSGYVQARPYPAGAGSAATADSAATAGNNPAGLTRFDSRNNRFGVTGVFTDNTWKGQLGANGPTIESDDDEETIIPSGNLVLPLNDDWYFGFSILGFGFSEDFGDDWPGRYFMQDYELLYVSAFPSIAYRVNDQWSVAISAAVTYTSYEQTKAILNLEPGFGDGQLEIDADGFTIGFSVSALYEHSSRTRFGLVYKSEIDAELDADADFKNLSPSTEFVLDAAGLLGASIDIDSRSPQSINAGLYHEFADAGAVTFDVTWIDFSRFTLSEIYVNGDQLNEGDLDYDDIWMVSASYTRPVNARLSLGIGAMYIDDMVSDDKRMMTLRLDDVWVLGVGAEWQWTETRSLFAMLSYIQVGDAPITTDPIAGIGSVTGKYDSRGSILLQVGMDLGTGPR